MNNLSYLEIKTVTKMKYKAKIFFFYFQFKKYLNIVLSTFYQIVECFNWHLTWGTKVFK